ncbi:MAG: cell division protein FtsX [Acidobacteria bacterium]|nr:cell division protein FtsX [Acidobacteriota bacterium]
MSRLLDRRRPSRRLRPAGFDELGLRAAMADRILPFLVAAMAFLALLALSGAIGAAGLAAQWEHGAGSTLTVQVPRATGEAQPHAESLLAVLRESPAIAEARLLTDDQLNDLLAPWLGRDAEHLALPLPFVIEVRLRDGTDLPASLTAELDRIAPGTLVENHGPWLARLMNLARSLQALAALALVVVVAVAVAVVAVATNGGLAARRAAVEIIHGLGASDGYIASRFATRAMWLAGWGGLLGAIAGVPLLAVLARLAAPFASRSEDAATSLPSLLGMLPTLPLIAGAIGWLTAQVTVRRWLLRLR